LAQSFPPDAPALRPRMRGRPPAPGSSVAGGGERLVRSAGNGFYGDPARRALLPGALRAGPDRGAGSTRARGREADPCPGPTRHHAFNHGTRPPSRPMQTTTSALQLLRHGGAVRPAMRRMRPCPNVSAILRPAHRRPRLRFDLDQPLGIAAKALWRHDGRGGNRAPAPLRGFSCPTLGRLRSRKAPGDCCARVGRGRRGPAMGREARRKNVADAPSTPPFGANPRRTSTRSGDRSSRRCTAKSTRTPPAFSPPRWLRATANRPRRATPHIRNWSAMGRTGVVLAHFRAHFSEPSWCGSGAKSLHSHCGVSHVRRARPRPPTPGPS